MRMPGFTAEGAFSGAIRRYTNGQFRFVASGKEVSAALTCVGSDCSFFDNGGGGTGDRLTGAECVSAVRSCLRDCRGLRGLPLVSCIKDCSGICRPAR